LYLRYIKKILRDKKNILHLLCTGQKNRIIIEKIGSRRL